MNKELSEHIISVIGMPAYIDRYSGVVQVLTDKDDKKLPGGFILSAAECGLPHQPAAIIPDSKYKGVLFFEDKGLTPTKHLSSSFGYRSEMRIVVWLNNDRIGMEQDVHSLSTYAISDLTQRLSKFLPGNGIFMMVRPAVTGVAIQDGGIFQKYDFDDKTSGYLQGNFQYFAIDISTTFYIPKRCTFPFTANPQNCN